MATQSKIKTGHRVMSKDGPGTVIGLAHNGLKVRLDINGRCETYPPSRLTRTTASIPEYNTREV
jgi:hypothetical protein